MAESTERLLDRLAGNVHRMPDGKLTIDGREFPWLTNGVSVEAGSGSEFGHLVVRIPFAGGAVVEPLLKWQNRPTGQACTSFVYSGRPDVVHSATPCERCSSPARDHVNQDGPQ